MRAQSPMRIFAPGAGYGWLNRAVGLKWGQVRGVRFLAGFNLPGRCYEG